MTFDDVDSLYQVVLLWAAGVLLVAAAVLSVTHTLALRDRVVLPPRFQRVAGWLVTGLAIGFVTLITADFLLTWGVAGGLGAWFLLWGWREGQLRRIGIFAVGAALPWMTVYVVSLVAFRASAGDVDYRFLVVLAAMAVATIGVVLMLMDPAPRPRPASASPTDRAMLLFRAIERCQAMGPVSAPLALGFLAGAVASTATLVAGVSLGSLVVTVASSAVFAAVTLSVMYVAVPPRVARAYAPLAWLIRVERRALRTHMSQRLPRTFGGVRRLLDSLPDTDELRPLRIELLTTFGRTAEARSELDQLTPMTATAEAEAAELSAHIAWGEGRTDVAAIDRLAAAVARIDDPDDRMRYTVAHALALTRAGIVAGDEHAIDDLASIQLQLGEPATALNVPYARAVIVTVLAFAAIGVLSAVFGGAPAAAA
jgi:hypothetical protein